MNIVRSCCSCKQTCNDYGLKCSYVTSANISSINVCHPGYWCYYATCTLLLSSQCAAALTLLPVRNLSEQSRKFNFKGAL